MRRKAQVLPATIPCKSSIWISPRSPAPHNPELRIHHIVFIPKCRRRILYQQLRRHLGEVFRSLAQQKESRIEEGHLMADHVHMMISIPPKYAVSQVVGFIKGKSAIHLARAYGERTRNFVGQHFWARGYFVSTVGRDQQIIREVHQEPGKGRSAPGSAKPLALTGHL
jgi:putative transposase